MKIVTIGFFPSNPPGRWTGHSALMIGLRVFGGLDYDWNYDDDNNNNNTNNNLPDYYDYDPVTVWTMTISSLILPFFLFPLHTSLWLHCLTDSSCLFSSLPLGCIFRYFFRLPSVFVPHRAFSFNLEFLFLDCWVLNDPLIFIFYFLFPMIFLGSSDFCLPSMNLDISFSSEWPHGSSLPQSDGPDPPPFPFNCSQITQRLGRSRTAKKIIK